MSKNERITENIVRDNLRDLDYYNPDNGITIEEQKSEIVKVKNLLSKASKNSKGNIGYPEFIISNKLDPNFIIIIECKSDIKKHESQNYDKPVGFAVDGVIHYAKHLSKKYTVLAIAVSGYSKDNLKVSTFLFPSEQDSYRNLVNEHGLEIEMLLKFEDYYRLASFDPEVSKKKILGSNLFFKRIA
ncbi:hypothetical protein [Chryseobacterium sp.]|uniref:hypothetical protein n=1 Tax=Chryseobacterium sp. TaxID=1871047 RepID=UPI00289ABEE4|nr:hypothetical protein [Chryseobacterium sp.]